MTRNFVTALGLVLTLLCVSNRARSETLPGAHANEWWKHAVFYEIYPRSFADAKNEGEGNIAGITSRLDYLQKLGIDAIWITPCYPSPQVDFGYDVADYENIAPEYGTLSDFDKLVAEGKKRNIRLLMDFVLNHTSDKHKWFLESRSSRTNPKRDWYIWHDARADGSPPNNWQSLFGHSAWTWDPQTKQYYYHFFYKEQPDLNWRNPEVRKAMFDAARFWLDRGVAGFRLDAVCTLFEDPALTDNPIKPGEKNAYGDPVMEDVHNHNACQHELHEAVRELRRVADSYPGHRVLIGETVGRDAAELAHMYGERLDEIQLPMNFYFAFVNKLDTAEFRKQIAAWDGNAEHGWPLYFLSNHDRPRHYVRYGDGVHNDAIAKMMASLLLTLRGSPIMYYGEEIGMTNNDPKRVEDVRDPIGKVGWPKEKGRDGERTPMQWTAGKNAGFSDVTPWLPVASNYQTHNVASEGKDSDSILTFYQRLLHLRRSNDALLNGAYVPLNEKDANVLSYLRKGDRESVLVALNMSPKELDVKFDLAAQGLKSATAKTLICSDQHVAPSVSLSSLKLAPFGVFIGSVPTNRTSTTGRHSIRIPWLCGVRRVL